MTSLQVPPIKPDRFRTAHDLADHVKSAAETLRFLLLDGQHDDLELKRLVCWTLEDSAAALRVIVGFDDRRRGEGPIRMPEISPALFPTAADLEDFLAGTASSLFSIIDERAYDGVDICRVACWLFEDTVDALRMIVGYEDEGRDEWWIRKLRELSSNGTA